MSAASIDGSKLIEELRLLHIGIRNNAHQVVVAATHTAYEAAKSTTEFKDKTGKTRGSIVESVDNLTGKVRAGGAAKFLEEGTRPHVIEARGGGALRFVVGDRIIYRRRVNHPGTRETRFMGQAADAGELTLEYGLELFTDAAIGKFNSSG